MKKKNKITQITYWKRILKNTKCYWIFFVIIKEIVEETRIDENGNVITVKKKTYKDKDGKEITEEEITDANGNKIKIKTKVYRDADGNEITEEERIDEFGKIEIKRYKWC